MTLGSAYAQEAQVTGVEGTSKLSVHVDREIVMLWHGPSNAAGLH